MQKCDGCGMFVTDPAGHLGHGMAQITAVPTFGGQTVEQIAASVDELTELNMAALKAIAAPLGITVKPGMSKDTVRDLIRAAR